MQFLNLTDSASLFNVHLASYSVLAGYLYIWVGQGYFSLVRRFTRIEQTDLSPVPTSNTELGSYDVEGYLALKPPGSSEYWIRDTRLTAPYRKRVRDRGHLLVVKTAFCM